MISNLFKVGLFSNLQKCVSLLPAILFVFKKVKQQANKQKENLLSHPYFSELPPNFELCSWHLFSNLYYVFA